ncbi:SDR family NAD(P)-dependent oxidoreductase [Foetidibacter luteolus]|uniref:SDR family NAD(P)-dependent oxidoreductase n=1 Tax=Foetidibacter luteolus TaxID=2608880 RepID=UPI00129B3CBE|nr:SDR family NAD(P)-dependent oxidoreductase [Foetidibacter luteolus]
MYYTLVTGSSSGIGKALAIECAARGMHVLLAALPGEELDDTHNFISSNYRVNCHALPVDLSLPGSAEALYNRCKQNGYQVNMLINNVGLGSKGAFEKTSAAFYQTQIQLNITTTCLLTRYFINDLQQHKPAYILNTGSLGGFFAMPHKAVYAASKAFVYTFSMSLALELKQAGIHVSVLCPGGVDTNANVRASNASLKGIARKSILQPEDVARQAITQMLKGRHVIIPGAVNKMSYYAGRIIPSFIKNRLVLRAFKNLNKHNY